MMLLAAAASAALLVQAKAHIAEASVNPTGVQFRNLVVKEGVDLPDWGKQTVVCMEANLPNRSGGYDGFKPAAFVSPVKWGVVGVMNEVFIDPRGKKTSAGAAARLSRSNYETTESRAKLASEARVLEAAHLRLLDICR